MVRTIRALALAAAAIAVAAHCYFDVSIFPSRLMGYEAYADLEKYLDPEWMWDFEFRIVRNSGSGAEYLVLASDNRSFGGDHVVVFDADLKVLGHYTIEELDAMAPANPYDGRGCMVDAVGAIVVGNRRFSVGERKLSFLDVPPTRLRGYGLAVPEAPAPDLNLVNIRGDNLNLRFGRYSSTWVFMPPAVIMPLSSEPWHEVEGAWLAGSQVLLVVRHDPDPVDTAHVLAMNVVMFATGGLATPLLAQAFANPVPSQPDIEWHTLGYTSEGFAAFRWTSNQYFRFDEFGIEIGAPVNVPDDKRPYDQRHLYGRTSGWYIFDLQNRSIERRKWWWE